ncbi:MAG TPA: AlpA family phage regulatory protein [Gemmatimonadaceae bacterium]|nr:AlpA family phage regulatory protein [Gemmatimonadaceae bacterium]
MNAQDTAVTQLKKRRVPVFDPTAEIVPPRDLRRVVGLANVTVWRLRRAGLFPQPLRLSVGRIGWRRADLEAWLSERKRVGR